MRRVPPKEAANKKLDEALAWITEAVTAIDATLDRVAHPGDFPVDLHRDLDQSAVDALRASLRDSDRVIEMLGDVRNDITDIEEEAHDNDV
jgi:hypothetical protein